MSNGQEPEFSPDIVTLDGASFAENEVHNALSVSQIGLWKISFDNYQVIWSDEYYSLLGLEKGDGVVGSTGSGERTHPDDKEWTRLAFEAHLKLKTPFDLEFRLQHASGHYVWVKSRGQAVWDDEGKPIYMSGSVIDITEIIELRLRQIEKEKELRLIFDNVPARIWFKDDANKIIRLNEAAAKSMGLTVPEAEGADTFDLFPEMAQKYLEDDLGVINSGVANLGIIEKYTPENGDAGWVRTDKLPYTDPDTDEKRIFVISQDITKRMQAQTELTASEERLSRVLEASADAYFDWKQGGLPQFVSERFWAIMGYDPESETAKTVDWQDLIVVEDIEKSRSGFLIHMVSDAEKAFNQEVRFTHKDGSFITFLVRGRIVQWNENATPTRIVGVLSDITEFKLLEKKRQELAERFNVAARGATAGLWDWPVDGQDAFWWSPVYYELLGMNDNEVEASFDRFKASVHEDDWDVFNVELQQHLNDDAPLKAEIRIKHKLDGYRWFIISGQSIRDQDGKSKRVLGSIIDIDELHKTRSDLEIRSQHLEQANRDLDHFAYVASHDLKAPLRGMDNLAVWIEEDLGAAITPDAKNKLELLKNRVARMEALLADILAFSRAGRQQGLLEDVSTPEIVEQITDWIQPLAGIKINVDGDLPTITSSRTMVEHIFLNLMSNAKKHHDKSEGVITIRCTQNNGFHEFEIADDGPGIPEEYQKYVFEIFKKLKPRDEVEGSGIGLAIVKKMVDALGGDIWIESQDGQRGTSFHFKLPVT